jgi:hypothetical protein
LFVDNNLKNLITKMYSILKKNPNGFFSKNPYPCGELRWAFNPNLGGKEKSERREDRTLSPFKKKLGNSLRPTVHFLNK